MGRATADCASMAVTAARTWGQFIAASSNMCVYCEPCPEKSAATLPRVSMPAARKCAPCLGSVHLASAPCERSRAATAPSTVTAWSGSIQTKPTRGCAAGVSRLSAFSLVTRAKTSATTLRSFEKALSQPKPTTPLASAIAIAPVNSASAASHFDASAALDGALNSSTCGSSCTR